MKQNLILLTTPRSGSTPVCDNLAQLLEPKSYAYLGEFFSLAYGVRFDSDDGIDYRFWRAGHPWTASDQEALDEWKKLAYHSQKVSADELALRIKLWQEDSNPKITKYFPRMIEHEKSISILESARVFCLERHDRWQQLLSYIISRKTGIWYKSESFQLPAKSVRAEFDHFRSFCMNEYEYQRLKAAVNVEEILVYEDWIQGGIAYVAKKLKMPAIKPLQLNQVKKQNLGAKEDVIENVKELRTWFQNSFLSESLK